MALNENSSIIPKLEMGIRLKIFGIISLIIPVIRFILTFAFEFNSLWEAAINESEIPFETQILNARIEGIALILGISIIFIFGFRFIQQLQIFYSIPENSSHHLNAVKKLFLAGIIIELAIPVCFFIYQEIALAKMEQILSNLFTPQTEVDNFLILINTIDAIFAMLRILSPIVFMIAYKKLKEWSNTQVPEYQGNYRPNKIFKGSNLAFIGSIILVVDKLIAMLTLFVPLIALLTFLTSIAAYFFINVGIIMAGNAIVDSTRQPQIQPLFSSNIPPNYGSYPPTSYQPNAPYNTTNQGIVSTPINPNLQPPIGQPIKSHLLDKQCRTCGKKISAQDKFCNYCGTSASETN